MARRRSNPLRLMIEEALYHRIFDLSKVDA